VRVRDNKGGRNISLFLARLSVELDLFGCGYKLVVMVSALAIFYSPLLSILPPPHILVLISKGYLLRGYDVIPSSCLQAPKRGTLKTSVPAPVEKKKVRVFCGYVSENGDLVISTFSGVFGNGSQRLF